MSFISDIDFETIAKLLFFKVGIAGCLPFLSIIIRTSNKRPFYVMLLLHTTFTMEVNLWPTKAVVSDLS